MIFGKQTFSLNFSGTVETEFSKSVSVFRFSSIFPFLKAHQSPYTCTAQYPRENKEHVPPFQAYPHLNPHKHTSFAAGIFIVVSFIHARKRRPEAWASAEILQRRHWLLISSVMFHITALGQKIYLEKSFLMV